MFNDIDGDGRHGPNDSVVSGALITVVLPDGTRRTTVADEQGRYAFAAVPPGRIRIEVLSNGLTRTEAVDVLDTTTQLDVPFGFAPLTLALTGDDLRWLTTLAFALLALGTTLLTARRRRMRP